MEDFYEILGVTFNANENEIRERYISLAKQHHPDHIEDKTGLSWRKANDRFAEITRAYKTLIDRDKRREYDRKLSGEVDKSLVIQAKNIYVQTRNAVKTKNWPAAESLINAAIKIHKKNEYLVYLSMIRIAMGKDVLKNLESIQRSLKDRIFEGFYHAIYAWSLYSMRRFDEAALSLNEAFKWDPECLEAIDLRDIMEVDGFSKTKKGVFGKVRNIFKKE
ncbi:DnaJ domain-containing protein [candidate division WOR-3 bacterium]|nr:DnaJ domain-containing protein [candidate division WOR-3 bacterium]